MSKPLQDKRIVVTRSPAQAAAFCAKLAAQGAEPILFPTIQFTPLPTAPLDTALAQLEQYDWLIFTSSNAVTFFIAHLENSRFPSSKIEKICVAAAGPATTRLLQGLGIKVDLMPDQFVGECLAADLGDVTGKRILLPRAKIGRPEMVQILRQNGAIVDDIPLYDTIMAEPTPADLAELAQGVDAITFTSPSTVNNFLKIMQKRGTEIIPWLFDETPIACIGPTTAATAQAYGLKVAIQAKSYTIDGLVTALIGYFAATSTIPNPQPFVEVNP